MFMSKMERFMHCLEVSEQAFRDALEYERAGQMRLANYALGKALHYEAHAFG